MLKYPITLRETKGSVLTYTEADHNFEELDNRTELGWRDNIVQLDTQPGNVNAPALNTFMGSISAFNFFAGEMSEAFAAFHIDHDYALGTNIYPHLHWSTTDNIVGTIRWGIEYTVAKGHQQQAFFEPITVYIEQTTTGTPYMHMVAEVSDEDSIKGALLDIEPDTLILARFFRDGTHPNDTLATDAFVFIVDLHYQANRFSTPYKRPDFLTPS